MADNPTGQKTEEPTPKRKEEAREEGNVAKSQELNQAFTLMGSFFLLYILFAGMMNSLLNKVTSLLTLSSLPTFGIDEAYSLLMENIYFVARLVAPIMLASAIMGAVINFIQVGPLFTGKSMVPKFSNIDPIKGAKKIFSLKTLMELIKSLLKISAITLIAYIYLKKYLFKLTTVSQQGIRPGLVMLGTLIFRIATAIIIFLIVLGIIDYIYQRWEYKRNLKMTKYEVKQERKEREGDPLYKQKRREKQREFSLNRMMAKMEEADVVITNPTHIAVALKYDLEDMTAPVILAMGEGYVANKIKEKARELEIEIVENKAVARTLNEIGEIGEEIPSELYEAVAEILAYVYKQDNKY